MTRKVKDLAGLIAQLKPRLQDYLEKVGTDFSPNGEKFQCPNRESHANNDITPSCGFFPNELSWHCFVCEESGDIFIAAHYLEGKPREGNEWITENVEYLAKLLEIEVEYVDLTEAEKLVYETYDALQVVSGAANMGLEQSPDVLTYVKEQRGWSDETIRTFQLGYCDYDKLRQALAKRNFSDEVLSRAGLLNKSLLHHRLLFPIKDAGGKTIGFASRTLLSEKERHEKNVEKYLNSQTSAVYKKSEALYNINQLQDETAWIVEGYADVTTLHQFGVKNIVGLGGVMFTEDHIQVLLKRGVKTLILCLDNDEEGRKSEERILNKITRRHGLSILVKDRDECKDPDSCLHKHDYLLKSGVTTLFEHYLKRYESSNSKEDRDKGLRSILLERSPIDRERLCKTMAKALGVRVEIILEEVQLLIDKNDSTEVNVLDLMRETRQFESQLHAFEAQAWNRGKLLGLSAGHPIFTAEMDGIQPAFYIVAGEEGTGKSAFLRSLMVGLLDENPDKVVVLYFSIDDSIPKVISRLLAADARLPINTMENPKWRIQNNESLSAEEKESRLQDRRLALKKLQDNSSAFVIKDESTVHDIEDMEKTIRTFKELAGDRQLIVFIDSLHRVRQAKKFHESAREQAQEISDRLKRWCTVYQIPVIATAELRKMNTPDGSTRRPTMDDIAEARDFKFDAECVMLLYNDIEANKRNPMEAKLKWEWKTGSGEWYPIVELFVGKNKTSAFSKRCLYYKFIPKCAKMFEATVEEQKKYRREALNA